MTAPPDRLHAVDSLRGFAMLLGVVLHAALAFATNVPAFWSVRDASPTPLADAFLFAVHTFRMQLFFLLAGFFGCLLLRRYGLGGMAWHRVKRVAVPLALAVPLFVPPIMAAFLYAELENVRASGAAADAPAPRRYAADLLAANPGASNADIIAGRVTSGAFVALLIPAHLWFLLYLLYFYVVVVLFARPLERLNGTPLLAALDARFRQLIEGRWRVLLPALLTVPPLLLMRERVADTPLGWLPQGRILAYYFGFFAFGWMLYRHRDLISAFGRGWRTNLAVANGLVLFPAMTLLYGGVQAAKAGEEVFAWRLAAFAAQAAYTWLMIVGLWGAFLHYFSRERAWVRYLADASYWCYLASITPIVALQYWVKDWPLPGELKWALVSAASMGVLLLSYELCVRYTFVGAILNGRKTRARNSRTMTQKKDAMEAEAKSS